MNTRKKLATLAAAVTLMGTPAYAQHTQSHDTTKAPSEHAEVHRVAPAYVIGAGVGPLLENPRAHNVAAMLYARKPVDEKTHLEIEGVGQRSEKTEWHASFAAFRSVDNGWFAVAGVRGIQTHAMTVQPFIGVAKEHGQLEFALTAGPTTTYQHSHEDRIHEMGFILSPELRINNHEGAPTVAVRGWAGNNAKPGIEARVLGPSLRMGALHVGTYANAELERAEHGTAKGAAIGFYVRF